MGDDLALNFQEHRTREQDTEILEGTDKIHQGKTDSTKPSGYGDDNDTLKNVPEGDDPMDKLEPSYPSIVTAKSIATDEDTHPVPNVMGQEDQTGTTDLDLEEPKDCTLPKSSTWGDFRERAIWSQVSGEVI